MFPVAEPAIENGIVEIRDGRIVSLGKSPQRSSQAVDLGEVALVPGWVNAHTHLEFSGLSEPLGRRGMSFARWIELVVADRMSTSESECRRDVIARGLNESQRLGTTTIGEIATDPADLEHYSGPLRCTVFLERLGRSPDHWLQRAESSQEWLQSQSPNANSNSNLSLGISPHAPYSVHPQLFDRLILQSQSFGCPMAMHLAESKEELQLMKDQTGPFVETLKRLGAWFPASYPRGVRTLDYLKTLSQVERSLVIHGNYLEAEDISFIAEHNARMSVIYCPRTHDYFDHDPYPLTQLFNAGINVAVGTDSRASNPDLSVFRELQTVRQKFPEIESSDILKMGTVNGAQALGLPPHHHSMIVGQAAHLNVVTAADPQHLFDPLTRCQPLEQYLSSDREMS